MLKKLMAVMLALGMVISMVSCAQSEDSSSSAVSSGESSEASDAKGTHVVVDHAGNSVEVPNEIQRIVVADIYPLPSVLAIFFDSADKIVGMAPASMTAAQNSLLSELYPEILQASTEFTDGTTVNVEELLKLEPDVVFYGASNPEIGDQMKQAGIPAIAISVNKWEYNAMETLNQWISLISELFPDNDKTEKVASYSEEIYNLVQERVADLPDEEKARVFFLFQYSDSAIATSGKSFFGQWWAEAIGSKNVSEELSNDNAAAVNMEQIYGWNPDTIFITNFNPSMPEDLYTNAVGTYDWSQIDAVKNQHVYKMPLGMYRSYTPGVDTPITLLWLAKTAYPELFNDIDITEKVIEYYKTIFGVTLTEEQAESIFTPVTGAGEVFG